jgi:hypothetical protein
MHIPRKIALSVLASVSVAGMAGASAASLGGLTGGAIGSDDATVASCDTDGVAVTYTTGYVAATQKYQITTVNFSGVDANCNGKAASVSLRNGTSLLSTGTSSAITVSPTNTFSLTLAAAVDASSVNGSSLVISG